MKTRIIKAVGALGGYQLARLLTAYEPKILMYHRFSAVEKKHEVSAAVFEQQLKLIKRYFNPMTLAQLANVMHERGRAPKHAVVITVDDGYRDFYEIAFPLLKHYQVPATFYVTTGFVNADIWLWPDQVAWLLDNKMQAIQVDLAGKKFDLSFVSEKIWWPIVSHFLLVSNDKRLDGLKQLEVACGIALPRLAPEKYSAVTWPQLAEMQSNGIEIGGHTVTHPSLGHMHLADAVIEIQQSQADLTARLGASERTFCYPNGTPLDYSGALKQSVIDANYTAAVTAFSDKFNVDIPFAWRRFVGSEQSFQFNKSLFGVEHLGNRVRGTKRCDY
jgi:peptidoglycan/xylan/chitin deacetylase (PgdA/CDA1 family)